MLQDLVILENAKNARNVKNTRNARHAKDCKKDATLRSANRILQSPPTSTGGHLLFVKK